MSKLTNNLAFFMVFLLVLTPFAFASQLEIKKVSDLQPGDVIVDRDGKEIPVEKIQPTDYNFMTNLMQVLTGKLPRVSLTGNVVAPITGNDVISGGFTPTASEAAVPSSGGSTLTIDQMFAQGYNEANAAYAAGYNPVVAAPAQAAVQPTVATTAQTVAGASSPPVITSVSQFAQGTQVMYNGQLATVTSSTGGLQTLSIPSTGTGPATVISNVPTAQLTGVQTIQSGVTTAQLDSLGAKSIVASTNAAGEVSYYGVDAAGKTTALTGEQLTGAGVDPATISTKAAPVAPIGNQAWLAETAGATAGTAWSSLLSGVQWAAVAYMAGQMLGPMLGLNPDQTQSLSLALAAGAGAYEFVAVGGQAGGFMTGAGGEAIGGWVAPTVGIAAFVIVLLLTYKDTKYEIVTFSCEPWQAPNTKNGGTDCEVCNDDRLPCSEYRCKSLGQACELVNPGTGEEKCVYVNPKDTLPPVITPNDADLPSKLYQYKDVKLSPPGPGFTIKYTNSSDGCIKAFTPLTFGITTDEPSQCKIDFNHTEKLEDMTYWFGGSNLYLYNHTEKFTLPGPANLKNENLTVQNGGKWTFFIRCRDKNGNENSADYALRFCVDPTPDTTPPQIKATSIENGGCVAANTQNASVGFYLNEPATCRWSKENQAYESMQGNMTCFNKLEQMNAQQLYVCNAQLDSIARDGTDYFVRCQDNAGNPMKESYKFNLKGSTPLLIKHVYPNETIFGGVNPAPAEIYVETMSGCESNKAVCAYSTSGTLGEFIEFADTNNADGVNTQKLFFGQGNKTVFVRCVDAGGNLAETSINFNVEIDINPPVVARAYQDGDLLKIVTVRDSECSYTNDNCDFLFEEGNLMPISNTTVHVTDWVKDKTYYIKCRDEFRNEEDSGCSLIVKPTNNFL